MELQVVIWVRSSDSLQNDNVDWNYCNPDDNLPVSKAIDLTFAIVLSSNLSVVILLRQ
jgi:hypothetical protein